MHEMARGAFTSHIRSYATHNNALYGSLLFHPKLLHLGHVAKSFAPREAPSGVGLMTSKQKALEKKQKVEKERKANSGFGFYKRKSDAILKASADEFGDGNVRKLMKLSGAFNGKR